MATKEVVYKGRFGKHHRSGGGDMVEYDQEEGQQPEGVKWGTAVLPLGDFGNKWERKGVGADGKNYLEVEVLNDQGEAFERTLTIFEL